MFFSSFHIFHSNILFKHCILTVNRNIYNEQYSLITIQEPFLNQCTHVCLISFTITRLFSVSMKATVVWDLLAPRPTWIVGITGTHKDKCKNNSYYFLPRHIHSCNCQAKYIISVTVIIYSYRYSNCNCNYLQLLRKNLIVENAV